MLKLWILSCVVVATIATNSYVVVLPRIVRPGYTLNIGVNILKATSDVTVDTALINSATNVTIVKTTGAVKPGVPQTLTLKVPRTLKQGSYRVSVTGRGGLVFSNTTYVSFNNKGTAVFIQTDKAMYKPGQTVNFRVFSVYPDLKPYTGTFDVEIFDPNSNKIKHWSSVKGAANVFTNKFVLSDQPVLGDWKIKVASEHQGEEKAFTVAEYVLPKFEVKLNLPSYGLQRDKSLTGSVEATYTYGKPVSGTARVRVKSAYSYRNNVKTVETSIKVEKGKGSFNFLLADFLTSKQTYAPSQLVVEANVTDAITGITMNGSSHIQYYSHGVKQEWLKSNPKNFKPGLRYTAYLKLSKPDSSLLEGIKKDVSIQTTVTYNIPENSSTTTPRYWYFPRTANYKLPVQNYSIPDNGLVEIKLEIPDNATSVSVQSSYPDSNPTSLMITKMYSPSKSYIQTFLISKRLSAGQFAEFEMKATLPLQKVVYQVLSRGVIVATGTVDGHGSKYVAFTVPVITQMAPNARIIVYTVREDGEIVTDSISFNVDGLFANKVSIGFNKNKAEPGQKVDLMVSADANSVVNLMAVDQSVILLKSGNDITASQVQEAVGLFDSVQPVWGPIFEPMLVGMARLEKRMVWWPYPYYYGGDDADDIFRNAGVIVLTDAIVFRHPEPIYPTMVFEKVAMGHVAGGIGGVNGMAPVERIRKDFPETWLWTSAAIGFSAAVQSADRLFHIPVLTTSNNVAFPVLLTSPVITGAVAGGMPNVMFKGTGNSGGSEKLQTATRVRKDFPETWLWAESNVGANGTTRVSAVVPDTITSWVASAFAINSVSGLGVAPTTAKLTAFRPFFVSLNLPYSVIRGEQLILQAIVFNYMESDMSVLVTLGQSESYLSVVDSPGNTKVTSGEQTDTIHVKAGEAKSVYFPIIPTALGKIDLLVKAQSSVAADAVQRQLLVEPEGVPHEFNIPVTIDLKHTNTFKTSVPINLPTGVVAGSQRARVTTIGDILGPTINNLDSLLKMPYGCGEQNMLNFAPDIFIMKYLTATNNVFGDIKSKATSYLEAGYQRELTYQHKDGSFSAFGDSDKSGSMWLTAFVVKSFHQAKPFIFIDDDTIKRAIDWMIVRQNVDGSFPEPGRVIHKAMQGGSASGTALTSFVLISLMENNDLGSSYEQRISKAAVKARIYLENRLNTMTDTYSLAITTYALVLAESTMAQTALNKLNSLAINQGDVRHWKAPEPVKSTANHYWHAPNEAKAKDVELTAYALLTYGERADIGNGLQIMKWIVNQRNPSGGFVSTQDTVLALQALTEFAKLIYSQDFNVEVDIQAGPITRHLSVNPDNANFLQTLDLETVPSSVNIHATGHGMILTEVSVYFNVEADIKEPSFEVRVQLLEETVNSFVLQTCARSLASTSGMAVQEIGIPSGFDADVDSIGEVKGCKRIETTDRKVILYFDEITPTATCLKMKVERSGMVAKSQPVSVRVYDYYSPDDQVTVFYLSEVLKQSSVCDVCLECDCKRQQ